MRIKLKPLSGFLVTVALLGGCHTTPEETCSPPSHCAETGYAPVWPAAGEIYPETSVAPSVEDSLHFDESTSPTSGYPAHAVPHADHLVLPESAMVPMAPGVLPEADPAPDVPDAESGLH